jgi:hypothetical protein
MRSSANVGGATDYHRKKIADGAPVGRKSLRAGGRELSCQVVVGEFLRVIDRT